MLRNFRIDNLNNTSKRITVLSRSLNTLRPQARPHAGLLLFGIILTVTISACSGNAPAPTATAPVSVVSDASSSVANVVNDDAYVASDPALFAKLGRPKVVEFFAFWCDVCRSMRPTVHALAAQYAKNIDFLYLDIDAPNTQKLQSDLNFAGLRPTLVFFDASGREIGRLTGFHKQDEITPLLNTLAPQS